ncbi:hypothetical protein [Actinomadura rifamycini]|uniref:hypothetical protein n=1 Tax=Actinomadura rifamycini TaxID=31962 RepID=UPI0004205AED|nr:hypothetical protein [Actinomadura rifamycini]
MSISYARPRPAVRRAAPAKHCPSCRTLLDGGPVLFRCPCCQRAVQAADVPSEVPARRPAVTA